MAYRAPLRFSGLRKAHRVTGNAQAVIQQRVCRVLGHLQVDVGAAIGGAVGDVGVQRCEQRKVGRGRQRAGRKRQRRCLRLLLLLLLLGCRRRSRGRSRRRQACQALQPPLLLLLLGKQRRR